jgi:hypothetical protein|tara:strand:- start:367 stop:1062 length:696 start_codon:yes stop_codon:yes gene_type:complete
MSNFILTKKTARLILLQRIQFSGPLQKKIRKLFGRYLFTNFIAKFFVNSNTISKKYHESMVSEFHTIKKYLKKKNQLYLSIGGGLGGLELIINKTFKDKNYYFIEKNYISKKIIYGWDVNNNEGYNNLKLLNSFLINNGMNSSKINIFNFDTDTLPINKFDVVVSLFSLDYHYNFNFYIDYLKQNSHPNTKIIFDTIRADYFLKIFKNVKIIKSDENIIHKSKRIVCSDFI